LAKQGFHVHCVDLSALGIEKLKLFAAECGVDDLLTAEVADLSTYSLTSARGGDLWDGIISVWCHLPSTLRQEVHSNVVKALKPGGVFVAEYYTPANIGRQTGGPQNSDMCVTAQNATEELAGLHLTVVEQERVVTEGTYHNGLSAVIQIFATK
jgi:hypothetical protein